MFGAANRDESTFGNSEAFDPTRDNLKEHIALGKAIISASAPLSRLKEKVAFEELVRRLKLPTFTEGNTFEYESSYVLRGLAGLEIDIEEVASYP